MRTLIDQFSLLCVFTKEVIVSVPMPWSALEIYANEEEDEVSGKTELGN